MSDAEKVALWLGLIGSVVSITLSLVAIWFTWVVNQRASAVNDQMIKALADIKSTTDHQSAEITDLIKVAWDKLVLGTPGAVPASEAESQATGEALQEIQEVLDVSKEKQAVAPDGGAPQTLTLDDLRGEIERVLVRQRREIDGQQKRGSRRGFDPVALALTRLDALNPLAVNILDALSDADNEPISADQVRRLSDQSVIAEFDTLIERNLLETRQNGELPRLDMISIPGNLYRALRTAIQLSRPNNDRTEYVKRVLAEVGYPKSQKRPSLVDSALS